MVKKDCTSDRLNIKTLYQTIWREKNHESSAGKEKELLENFDLSSDC